MSLLRKKKFRIGVFCVSGALILYNVYFFTLGKKKPEKAPAGEKKKKSAPAEDGSGSKPDDGSWGEVKKATPPGSPAAAAADPTAKTFGRDPFVLPEEEKAGKTFEAIFRERLEAGRGAENTPLHEVLAQLGVLQLTGILHDERKPVAVINHRLVRPGDTLLNGFFDVVAVDPDAVRVRHGGKDFRVPLPEKKVVETAPPSRDASLPAAPPAEKE